MAVLGTTVALCLLCSFSVALLDPLLLEFFIHDCNIHIIHPTLLTNWHPAIKHMITDWIDLGPDRDAGPKLEHTLGSVSEVDGDEMYADGGEPMGFRGGQEL